MLKKQQLTIGLAFSMTIYNAQGKALKKVGLYFNDPVFSHSQLDAAKYSVQKPDYISTVLSTAHSLIFGWENQDTANIVYKTVLC